MNRKEFQNPLSISTIGQFVFSQFQNYINKLKYF